MQQPGEKACGCGGWIAPACLPVYFPFLPVGVVCLCWGWLVAVSRSYVMVALSLGEGHVQARCWRRPGEN